MGRFEICNYLFIVWLINLGACGTIVGNPKKPVDDTSQTNNNYEIPEIKIEMPEDDDNSESVGLRLATDEFSDLNLNRRIQRRKVLLFSWVKRVNSVVREINRISRRVNQISRQHTQNDDKQIIFSNQGEQGHLSGKIEPITSEEGLAYQAVLCHEGDVFAHLRWSTDADKIVFTKDFRPSVFNGSLRSEFMINAVFEQGQSGANLKMNSQGTWVEELIEESRGTSLLEFGSVNYNNSNTYEIKAVSHRYQDQLNSELISGDSYLTGKLVPRENSARYLSEFLAFLNGAEACGSFSEDESIIWNPDSLGDTGWCFGSPLGGISLRNEELLKKTYKNLQPVGYASSTSLDTVSFSQELSCQ